MQSYEKILYNAEIFFLFSWLKNYKKIYGKTSRY